MNRKGGSGVGLGGKGGILRKSGDSMGRGFAISEASLRRTPEPTRCRATALITREFRQTPENHKAREGCGCPRFLAGKFFFGGGGQFRRCWKISRFGALSLPRFGQPTVTHLTLPDARRSVFDVNLQYPLVLLRHSSENLS